MRTWMSALALVVAMPVVASAKTVDVAPAAVSRQAPRADRVVQAGMRMFFLRHGKLIVQGQGGNQRVAFDPSTLSKPGAAVEIDTVEMAPNGDKAVVLLATPGESARTLVVLDVRAGLGPERVPGVRGASWLSAQRFVYRLQKPAAMRVHDLGSDPGKDRVVLAPGSNATIHAFPKSTWAIAQVDEGLFVAKAGIIGNELKWKKLFDAKSEPVTALDVDGDTLYFVSKGELKKHDLNPGGTVTPIAGLPTPVAGVGVTEVGLIVKTTDEKLWEMRKSGSIPLEIPVPSGRKISFSTQAQSPDVVVTVAGSGAEGPTAFRWSDGKATPIDLARLP